MRMKAPLPLPATQRPLRAMLSVGLMAIATFGWTQELAWAGAIGAEGDDVVQAMTVDVDGDVLVAGYFEGEVDMDPGPGELWLTANGFNDVYVQKLTEDGELIWALGVGGEGPDYATGISTDATGNIHVVGAFNEVVDFDPGPGVSALTSVGEYDMFLAEFSPDGALLQAQGIGSTGYDEPKCVAVGALGNVYVLSYFSGTIDVDPGVGVISFTAEGALDMLLQKFDDQGTLLWAQVTGSDGADLGLSMALDEEENVWITGSFEGTIDMDPLAGEFPLTSAGAWDIFVTKRSPLGELIWAGRMGGQENFDTGYDIAVDGDGNAIVVGSFFGTGDFDPGAGVHPLTASSLGSDEIFVQKLGPTGEFLWAMSMGGTDSDLAYGVSVAEDGRIDVTGFFSGTADFDPDPSEAFPMTTSSLDNFFDSYVCALSGDGAFLGAWQFAGASSVATQSIARGEGDALFIAGHFENTADFDPGLPESTLSAGGFRDAFVMRLDPIDAAVRERGGAEAPVLYPNPATDHLWIEVDAASVNTPYTVSDAQGRTVAQGRSRSTRTRLELDALEPGLYHLHLLRSTARSGTFVVIP
jgi:hypothetical protein